MDRFKNILSFKRTNMIDEAKFFHEPKRMHQYLLSFLIVFLISQLVTGFLGSIPMIIRLFADGSYLQAATSYANGLITEEQLSDVLIDFLNNVPHWMTALSLFFTFFLIVASVFYCKKYEHRDIRSMGLRKEGAVPEYLVGLLIGALMFTLALLISLATGAIEISINPKGFNFLIILFFLAFVVQGAAEEFLVRGFLMVSIARDYRAAVAIAVSSVAFSIMHIGNTGFGIIAFINITLVGILLGVYIFKRGNILGACAIHTAWNFVQGNIFGVSVSGMSSMPSVFLVEADEGLKVLNGGSFGIENSLPATLVLIVFIFLALLMKTNPKEESSLQEDCLA